MKPQIIQWKSTSPSERQRLLKRPTQSRATDFRDKVCAIIQEVRENGDLALSKFTKEFDKVSLSSLQVSPDEIQSAYQKLKPATLAAIREAIRRVTLFHEAQLPKPIRVETSPGVCCERRFLPIDRVGLYVPGGTAPLPSTVIMLGVPSRIAGCTTRILVTPPRKDMSIDPTILVTADILGISTIYKAGGAQAIAAMAYGTKTIPKVDKIFGPGNSWVTEAKLQVSQDPEGAVCDMPAGPSEVMVIADESASPSFIAADLLSQAEHGPDSQVILVTTSPSLIAKVQIELDQQLEQLPRKAIAAESLSKSLLIEVATQEESLVICNQYAPEHLIVQLKEPRHFASSVTNAGSIFLGPWTPESMGDYASGTNHVLPTYGFARAIGGLSTESFMKSLTIQELSLQGLKDLGPVVQELAEIECLDAHKRAVAVRLREVKP